MQELNYDELRRTLRDQGREINALDPEFQSTEWYVLKYLRRIERSLAPECGSMRIENSMRGFVRFYVDRVETGSRLAQRCLDVYGAYRRSQRRIRGASR